LLWESRSQPGETVRRQLKDADDERSSEDAQVMLGIRKGKRLLMFCEVLDQAAVQLPIDTNIVTRRGRRQ
jgi:hypothetical protein